jgi:hypothetical protein
MRRLLISRTRYSKLSQDYLLERSAHMLEGSRE